MNPIGESITVGWVIDDVGRRSATRTIDPHLARAIARGLTPFLAEGIEVGLLDDLDITYPSSEGVEITWTAHAGQPPGMIERLPWYPGTPLPDQTLLVSCTVSAPLQD